MKKFLVLSILIVISFSTFASNDLQVQNETRNEVQVLNIKEIKTSFTNKDCVHIAFSRASRSGYVPFSPAWKAAFLYELNVCERLFEDDPI